MMKNMTLENIATVCGVYHGDPAKSKQEVTNIVIDSRKIEPGGLFIATKGERVDGHSFIRQVMEKGALAVVSEQELPDADFPYILVKDSFTALKQIAAFYREQLSVHVVGITGSVGKTSTKEMIAGVLSAKYHVMKTEGNFNNEIGLPLTILRIREEDEVAVLEMGISDFGEMSRLTQMAKPDISVITNIGQCHLENLKTRDGILKAKTEIFEGMNEHGKAVLNGGDDKLRTVKLVKGHRPYYFNDPSCYADHIVSHGIFGTSCEIHMDGELIRAEIKVPGQHQVTNTLAAVRVAMLLGLDMEQMTRGIASVVPIAGRNRIIQEGNFTLIDDCYNANPVSMKAALDLLSLADTRKVAILGDMFELGENSDMLHSGVGCYAKGKTDLLICIGENAKHIYDGAKEAGVAHIYHFTDKESFLREKENLLQAGDTILLKASHGMAFETLISQLLQ